MKINIIKTEFEGLVVIEPKVFGDERGYFFESYNYDELKEAGIENNWIQDNEAFSSYGILRGLHYQKGEFAQAKLVRVIKGKVLDYVIDLRKDSPTFKKGFGIELSEENKKQLLVPRGFAHAYVVLSETAIFQYKVDNVYNPGSEAGIKFDDPDLNIDWGVEKSKILISDKDKELPFLKDISEFF